MPHVYCRAVYCAHNFGGDVCNASVIKVNEDRQSGEKETDCSTFIPREFAGSLLALLNVNYSGLVAQAFSGQRLASPQVYCSVKKCRYNEGGRSCAAGVVEILEETSLSSLETRCGTFIC